MLDKMYHWNNQKQLLLERAIQSFDFQAMDKLLFGGDV